MESYEGVDYEYEYNLHISDLGYAIYIREGFGVIKEDDSLDRIVFSGVYDANNYILIIREEFDHEVVSNTILRQLEYRQVYEDVELEIVGNPVQKTLISGFRGFSYGPMFLDRFYVVRNPHGGCFVIYTNWLPEGADGQILYNMLADFRIIE